MITRTRRQLDAPGFIPHKWGGLYLRAPQVFFDLFEQRRDKFVKIGDVADVWRGITTGANHFFVLDQGKIDEWRIESEFLSPILDCPRRRRNLVVANREMSHLFGSDKSEADLSGTRALEYIRSGEEDGVNRGEAVKNRSPWYDTTFPLARLHANRLINEAVFFFVCDNAVVGLDSFYGFAPAST